MQRENELDESIRLSRSRSDQRLFRALCMREGLCKDKTEKGSGVARALPRRDVAGARAVDDGGGEFLNGVWILLGG